MNFDYLEWFIKNGGKIEFTNYSTVLFTIKNIRYEYTIISGFEKTLENGLNLLITAILDDWKDIKNGN